MNEELYKKLYDMRETLRKIPDDGRFPNVCSDAALKELSRLAPKTKEELILVGGLGKAFVDKFGDAFMEVLNKYHESRRIPLSVLSGDVKTVLGNLENRLININKRNRLLYMPKLPANVFDLCGEKLENVRLLDFILRPVGNARIKVCDLNGGEEAEKLFKRYQKLQREVNRDERESGEKSLYIGYPFVSGRTGGEAFDVRAPLALFPVELILTADSVLLKVDDSKDVLLNNSLVLTHYKFNGINADLPENDIERGADFMERLFAHYAAVGIKLTGSKCGPEPFIEYKAKAFPKYKCGEFVVTENVVLGRFSMCSSSIQRDFKDIIASGKINPLLNDLLEDIADVDIYSDSEDMGAPADVSEPKERDLNYINDLNISQERAIVNINLSDRLVVQGPPGTGKSQTITSMIADFVNKGRNVLMVSQKKAALDVIYSRLGRQSKFALLLGDVKNKDDFYEQLYKIFTSAEEPAYSGGAFETTSATIDADLEKLDTIADKLYYDTGAGAPMYRIYEDNIRNTFRSESAAVTDLYAAYVPKEILGAGYGRLKEMRRFFSDGPLTVLLKKYKDLDAKYPWLKNLKSGAYSAMQIKSILSAVNEIVDVYVKLYSMNALRRAFQKGMLKKPIKKLVKTYFTNGKGYIKEFMREPTELYNGFEHYEEFYTMKAKADELTVAQRTYFDCMYTLSSVTEAPLIEVNNRIFDYCSYAYISEFEAAGREIIAAIGNFDGIIRGVTENLDRKKTLTKERLKATLVKAYRDNIESSKRKGEMQRVIDGKRRMSVTRFISKFRFELFKGVKIWLMTPEVVSEVLPLESDLFDLLIFDEASQIYIEKGVPSIARAKKVVIAGDNKQLRPSSLGDGRIELDEDAYNDEDVSAALEEESLLDLARFKYPEIMLNYHYRSRYEELIAFSNYAFYKGRLNISPNTDTPVSPPIEVIYTPDGRWEDRRNEVEAVKVVELIKEFFRTRANRETLGIITFNASQRDLICDRIDDECVADPAFAAEYAREFVRTESGEDVGLFIKNIENVQGDERDHIIFSLAYAKNKEGKVVRNFGWLNQEGGENRLNVAVSRAKRKIQIVSSIHYSDLKVDDLKNEGPRIFRKYLEYAEAVSSGNSEAAKLVLRSFGNTDTKSYSYEDEFVFDAFKELSRRGLRVERSVGMGAYKIDIAVLDTQGNYRLGIECDANLYNRSHSARERDVHLRRYLADRGWKLYRLWSPNWWHGIESEIKNIRKAAGV